MPEAKETARIRLLSVSAMNKIREVGSRSTPNGKLKKAVVAETSSELYPQFPFTPAIVVII
jgi:hypothetical protein